MSFKLKLYRILPFPLFHFLRIDLQGKKTTRAESERGNKDEREDAHGDHREESDVPTAKKQRTASRLGSHLTLQESLTTAAQPSPAPHPDKFTALLIDMKHIMTEMKTSMEQFRDEVMTSITELQGELGELKTEMKEVNRSISGLQDSLTILTQETAPRLSPWVKSSNMLSPSMLVDPTGWPRGANATWTYVQIEGDPAFYVIGAAYCALLSPSFSLLPSSPFAPAIHYTRVYAPQVVLECATHVLVPPGLLTQTAFREKDVVMFKLDAAKMKGTPQFAQLPTTPVDPRLVEGKYVVGNTGTAPVEGHRPQFLAGQPYKGIYLPRALWRA